ncbi:hypothetical protein DFH09DRAFT_1070247 [Mycena vulgaris]|nr:hypothetical protein DFH09DRAFT_1070247 [Mycena vulgaris]
MGKAHQMREWIGWWGCAKEAAGVQGAEKRHRVWEQDLAPSGFGLVSPIWILVLGVSYIFDITILARFWANTRAGGCLNTYFWFYRSLAGNVMHTSSAVLQSDCPNRGYRHNFPGEILVSARTSRAQMMVFEHLHGHCRSKFLALQVLKLKASRYQVSSCNTSPGPSYSRSGLFLLCARPPGKDLKQIEHALPETSLRMILLLFFSLRFFLFFNAPDFLPSSSPAS